MENTGKLAGLAFQIWLYTHRDIIDTQPLSQQNHTMKRVLVIDDEQITADTLALIFRKRGFDTRVAYTVDAALDFVRESDPELILCDITMPGRDGLEFMVELTRMNSTCPVIVLTGYLTNLPPVREQIRKMRQSTHVFLKPCPPDDILREATRMLAVAS